MKIRAMYEYPKQSLATQPSIVVHSDGCNGRKVISFAHVPSYRYLAEVRRTLPYYDEEVTFDADDISTQSLSSGVTDVPLADPVRPDFFTTQDECRINDWIEGTQLASATLPAIPLPAASTCPADSCTSTQAVVGSYLPKGWPSKRLWHFCVDHGFSTHTHSRQAHGSFFSHNSPDPEDASCALTSALPPVGVMMDEDGAVRASRDAERTEEMLRIFEEFTNPEVLMRDVRPGLGLRDESSYGWLPKQHERAERWEVNGRRVQGQGKMLLGSCADGFEF
ncbi:hypothetical protein EST38_g12675 [Candolleomyces aberdarensis]|uniref:Uncharacterized protein n=1 Tax=Candolleomyces aberdarensis TaxID=2316362 RepID=A0A4Q2D2L4_9AGAR|nr:hypothetical protein EST38_g12675 [Candolleomyces aberdarensis]